MSNYTDNSMRNLTYAAIALVIGAFGYLVYKNSKKTQSAVASAELASPASSLSATSDTTLGGVGVGSSAQANGTGVAPDGSALGDAATGTVVKGGATTTTTTAPTAYDAKTTKPTAPSSEPVIKELSLADESGSSSTASADKLKSKGKSQRIAATKTSTKSKYYVTPGDKGDYMVVAGSFTSKQNADTQVAALKKAGFKFAEAVKMGNSANNVVIAARYPYRGGAEATVRDLAKKKIKAYVKKKEGDVYKPETTPVGAK